MKGGDNVAKKTVKPYHSPKGKVHHTNPNCTEGNNIERANIFGLWGQTLPFA